MYMTLAVYCNSKKSRNHNVHSEDDVQGFSGCSGIHQESLPMMVVIHLEFEDNISVGMNV